MEHKKEVAFSPDIFLQLEQYDWPGNVRELANEIERIVILAENGIPTFRKVASASSHSLDISNLTTIPDGASYHELMEYMEGTVFRLARQQYKTSVAVAKALKIGQTTAARKLRKYT